MVSLTRSYSSLGNYQNAHQVVYSIETTVAGQRFLIVKQTENGAKSETVTADIPPHEAEELLQFLYENSISLEHWKDVLEDLLPEGCLCT